MIDQRLRMPRLGRAVFFQALLFVGAIMVWDVWQKRPHEPARADERPEVSEPVPRPSPKPSPKRSDLEVKVVQVEKTTSRPMRRTPKPRVEKVSAMRSPAAAEPLQVAALREPKALSGSPPVSASSPRTRAERSDSPGVSSRRSLASSSSVRTTHEPASSRLSAEPEYSAQRSPLARSSLMQSVEKDEVEGVPLRVLVPRSPRALAHHLMASGGCLVVSRLFSGRSEVVAVFSVEGGSARLVDRAPCHGIPRILRDQDILDALGDPLRQVRQMLGGHAPEHLVVQLILTPLLEETARRASRRALGALPVEQLARRARETGYAIRCLALSDGGMDCR